MKISNDSILTDYEYQNKLISPREHIVLCLIVQEFTVREMATQLYISASTIISHKKNLKRKLEVRNNAGLVRKAYEYGLIKLRQKIDYSITQKALNYV